MDAPSVFACAMAANGGALGGGVEFGSLLDFVEMVGEDYLPRTFIERVKDIKLDEFSYFQVHLALKAPVRYALHEANDPAVGQAMNVTMGPETPADLDDMWQEIRAGEFPEHVCLHAICPTAFDPLAGAQDQTCGFGLCAGAVSAQRPKARGLGKTQKRLHGHAFCKSGGVTRPI